MQTSKRIIAVILALIMMMTLVLTGCGQQAPAEPTAPAEPAAPAEPEDLATEPEEETYIFNCLNPCPDKAPIEVSALAERVDTLDGKTLVVCANYNNGFYDFVDGLAAKLVEILPNTNVIYVTDMIVAVGQGTHYHEIDVEGLTHMTFDEFMADPSIADAAIVTNAFCGNASASVVQYSCQLEKAGVPTVFTVYDYMESITEKNEIRTTNAMPNLRHVVTGGTLSADTNQHPVEIQKAADACIEALTTPLTEDEKYAGMYELPKEPTYLYQGNSYADAMAAYEGNLTRNTDIASAEFTDGSPIQLPTEELVAEMLAATSHAPDEIVGTLGPLYNNATVQVVAVNGVMAGCKPEMMPVLLALTEAMANTDIAEANAGASGWFCFGALVAGSITDEVKLNYGGANLGGAALMTPGIPANTSLGRFIRLMMLNVGGTEPGVLEAKNIGNPHKTSIITVEDAGSPWPQWSTELGYEDGTNTLSFFVWWGDILQGVNYPYSGPTDEENPVMEQVLGKTVEGLKLLSRPQQGYTLWLGTNNAKKLAEAGYTRQDAKEWIKTHCVDTYEEAMTTSLGKGVAGTLFSVQGESLWPSGSWPEEWSDPNFDPQTIVEYYPNLLGGTILVNSTSAAGVMMNGTPRWTVEIDPWR